MPTFAADHLADWSRRLLQGLGVPAEEAQVVAEVLVEANLVGHDSHGVLRLPQYADYLRHGHIRPGAPFEIVRETPASAVVDGHMNFGHVTMTRATGIAVAKARGAGVAAVLVRGCHHIGRLGTYVSRAARQGLAAWLAVNSPGGRCVAPWGGIDRRMGTNPIAFAVPTRTDPLVLDMTTSVAAEGKVRVLHQQGRPAPPDWLLDHSGQPTTRTADFYADPPGALRPLGGSVGYKGFGLSVMLDLLCGALSGQGALRPDLTPGHNGVSLVVWDIRAFVPMEFFFEQVDQLSEWIKSSRPVPDGGEILLPGEIEMRTAATRRQKGIPIPEGTWTLLSALSRDVGIELPAESEEK